MSIMSENQFKTAVELLNSSESKSLDAAKRHLVDGMPPVEAAKEFNITRQAVNSAINRVKNSYIKALKIKRAFDAELTTEKKFDIAMLLLKNDKIGRGLQAARLVMVNGLTNQEASSEHGISVPVLHNSIERVIEYYDKALAIKLSLSNEK